MATSPSGKPTFANLNAYPYVSSYQTFAASSYKVFFVDSVTTQVMYATNTIALGANQNRTVLLLNSCQANVCDQSAYISATIADLN